MLIFISKDFVQGNFDGSTAQVMDETIVSPLGFWD